MAEKSDTTARRQAERHTLYTSIAVFDHGSGVLLGYLNDLSTTGLGLTVGAPMPLNHSVDLRLEVPEKMSFGSSLVITGKGVWCVPAEMEDMHHCGFRFTSPNHELSSKLFEVIRLFTK